MSVQAIDWALRLVKNVSPTQKLILICLANHAGPDGTCWPSQTVVSDYSGLSRDAVNRNIKELESLGLIGTERRKDADGRETTKIYRLNMAESLAVLQDDTGGAEMGGRCRPGRHLINSGPSEEQKDVSPDNASCLTERHRCGGERQTGVVQDDTDCLTGRHKSLRKEPSKEETETKDLNTLAPSDFSSSEKSSKPEPDPPPHASLQTGDQFKGAKEPQASGTGSELTDPPPHKRIRMDRKTIRWTGILPDDIERWKESYPAVDVEQQLREMEVWASAHQSQWKSNWLRFIVHWLSKEQDKGGSFRQSNHSGLRSPPKTFEQIKSERTHAAAKRVLDEIYGPQVTEDSDGTISI